MENVSDGWLTLYLAVIPITAVVIVAFFGGLALIIWVLGLGARAVFLAMNKSHPITSQEEID